MHIKKSLLIFLALIPILALNTNMTRNRTERRANAASTPVQVDYTGIHIQDRSGSNLAKDQKTFDNFKGRVVKALNRDYIRGFAMVYSWKGLAPKNAKDVSYFSKYDYRPIDFALAEATRRGEPGPENWVI